MNNQWFRLYHEFATDHKVQMLSETDQRRYIMLLCLRCSNGDVTLHVTEVAFYLRVSVEEWNATKLRLIDKNLIDDDAKPIAWDKRQYKTDSSATRVAKHRNKVKRSCNVTVTPPETETDTERDRKEKDKKEKKPRSKFIKPDLVEVSAFAIEHQLNLSGFYDFYESNGWKVGKNPMKSWTAAANGWHKRQNNFNGTGVGHAGNSGFGKESASERNARISRETTRQHQAAVAEALADGVI